MIDIRAVVKRLVNMPTAGYSDRSRCEFCLCKLDPNSQRQMRDRYLHAPDCPIVQAREWLKEAL